MSRIATYGGFEDTSGLLYLDVLFLLVFVYLFIFLHYFDFFLRFSKQFECNL